MKHFLIVTTSQYEMSRYYNFVVDTLGEMINLCYCGKNHGRVETKDFNLDIMIEGQYPIHAKKLDNFIYLGSDKEYEQMFLAPLLVK